MRLLPYDFGFNLIVGIKHLFNHRSVSVRVRCPASSACLDDRKDKRSGMMNSILCRSEDVGINWSKSKEKDEYNIHASKQASQVGIQEKRVSFFLYWDHRKFY